MAGGNPDDFDKEKRAVDGEFDAAERDVDDVLRALPDDVKKQNPHFRDSIEKIAHDERAAELLELLDSIEEESSIIISYIKQFLEMGSEFRVKYPERVMIIELELIQHRAIKRTQRKEKSSPA